MSFLRRFPVVPAAVVWVAIFALRYFFTKTSGEDAAQVALVAALCFGLGFGIGSSPQTLS
jgi:hypothetical protein